MMCITCNMSVYDLPDMYVLSPIGVFTNFWLTFYKPLLRFMISTVNKCTLGNINCIAITDNM